MQLKNGSKRTLLTLSLAILLVVVMVAFAGILIIEEQQQIAEQNKLQESMLAELDARFGDYDETKIVLNNTSHSRAKALAEAIGAKLRITKDGSFATLTLTDGRTIRDVVANEDNKALLESFGIDYKANISDIEESEEEYERTPKMPNGGYISQEELGNYLGYMNIGDAWNYGYKGNGVTVAIIDSGIDTDHPEFAGRISEYSYNATEDKIVKDWILDDGSYDWSLIEDEQGHGTAVAGTLGAAMDGVGVTGIAPEVTIIVIKAECDAQGRFKNTSDLVFGLYYAIERDVSVVNMSFGTSRNVFAEPAQLAYDSDVICVAAAGNDSTAALTYPAADPHVIGVGALEDDGWELATYSNYGENVNVVAPGTVFTAKNGGGYTTMHGTSLASPLVAGVVSLFIQNAHYTTFDDVCEVLYASSYDLGTPGADFVYGYGAVDVNAFILEERGTITYDMMTDELDDEQGLFIRNHTIQSMLEPERLYAVFDGWYYDPHYVQEFAYYEDRVISDITLYAKWVSEDDEVPFTYRELDDGTIEITSYRGKRRFISVPEYIDGKLVTSIGDNAFSGQTRLREVNLPAGINNIGAGAFLNCTNITRIDIPENVTTIGVSAFNSCVRLAYINFSIHPKLTYIGDQAFAYCASLLNFNVPKNVTDLNGSAFFGATAIRAFTVDKNNTNFLAEDGVLFNATKSTLVAYPANRTSVYTVPNTVTTIGTCAFGFTRASSVDLGNVQTIEGSAFQNSALTSIIIPDTVTTLGKAAFAFTGYLREVTLSNNLTKIPSRAFYVSAIQAVTIPNSVRGIDEEAFDKSALMELVFQECSQLLTIGGAAFSKTSIIEVELPASLVSIGAYAFFQNKHLSAITFEQGSNLISIGVSAFEGESTLTSISLPESLRSIGDFAFSDSGITGTQHIPQNLSYFGEGAFASCSKLTGFDVDGANNYYNSIDGVVYSEDGTRLVAYPAGNTNYDYAVKQGTLAIGGAAFYGAQYVNYVYLNSELEDIGNQSFTYATSLNYMQIPDNTIKIGRYAFEGTSSLTTVSFSENAHIARLGFAAFANSGIQYITIPKNVSTMAQKVFEGCDNLQSITFAQGSKLESISAYMFDGCSNLQTITFESGSALTSIQAHGLEGMKNLQSIDFGDAQLTNIDNFAFRFCNSLTEFNIPDTVTNIGRYAFYYCENLSSVTIPASVEHIGSYAFLGTEDCELFFVSETLPEYLDEDWDYGIKGYYLGTQNVTTDGDWTYATLASGNVAILKYNGSAEVIDLNTLDFGNIVTIGGKAFAFSQVKHITLPESLVTIQAEAFFGSQLEEITIPSTVEFIGKDAFYNTPINSLTFEDNSHLKVIEQSAFENTKELASVTLPASLTQMGTAVFRNSGITSVTFAKGIGLTEISNNAFAYTQLTSVTIPNTVTKVGDGSFRNCPNLATFNYGDQELWLGANAFYDSGLTSFHISKNLHVIEEFALASLNELTAFTVDEVNAYYTEVDGMILRKDGKKLITAPAGMQGDLVIPQSVEMLGFGSFEATELSSVTFPAEGNILCIANRAFLGAENLTEITIPQSVVSIDYYAFAYATNLEKVTFEEGSRLTGIYEGAFYGCSNLSDILLPDTIVEISDFGFYGCKDLTELPISENSGLKGIYSYAFAYTGLTEFVVPEGIIDIDDYSFMGTDLTKVVISNASEKELRIGIGAFESCNQLEHIELPFIGARYEDYEISWFGYIFGAGRSDANQAYIPESLKTVKINGSITFVGNNAFYGVTSIDSIELPNTVDTLCLYAFFNSDIEYELHNPVHLRYGHSDEAIQADEAYFGTGIKGHLTLADDITSIGRMAFYDCISLTSITIPEGITSIGDWAFGGCSGLTSITIPEGVTSIEYATFYDCASLTSITIPSSVTSIDESAFYGCYHLFQVENKSDLPITFDNYLDYGHLTENAKLIIDKDGNKIYRDGHESFTYIDTPDGFRFVQDTDGYKLIAYIGNAETVTLPLTINGNSYLIDQMKGVKNVIIPDGFTIINDWAFEGCDSLISITIPDSVTSIGGFAFSGCTSIESIAIPDSVTSIGGFAFYDCTSLTNITIPDSVISIGSSAFYVCTSLKDITIPNSVTYIDARTFSGCTSLTNVTIPSSVTSIGLYAFEDCESLKNVLIDDITSWLKLSFDDAEANPLYYADNLYVDGQLVTQLTIPQGVTSIGSYAFCNFDGLTNVSIPSSVTEIGINAFSNSSARISIDENNHNFAEKDGVIYNKDFTQIILVPSSVTEVVIPKTVLEIGEVFQQNKTITSISFEEGTTIDRIPSDAFKNCSNLTSITIPDSVTSIEGGAFEDCTSLTSITIPNGVTSIENVVFQGCTSLTSITIPSSVTSIGSYAFFGCIGLTNITIPDSVTHIGDWAFGVCANLMVVENKSDLLITFDNYLDYGHLTENAKLIIDKDGNKIYRDGHESFTYIDTPDGFRFVQDTDGYKLIAYLGNEETVTLPLTINGNSYLIDQMKGVKNVIIPDGFTIINDWAFHGCSSLISIKIPESVTSIGFQAFSRCTSLANITIPNSVTSVGKYAFDETAYYNEPSNWTDDGMLFIGNHLIDVSKDVVECCVPSNTISIAQDAFDGCYLLKYVEILKYREGIGWLGDLSNLETLVIYDLTSECRINVDLFLIGVPSTLKSIVLKGDTRVSKDTFFMMSDITIFVEGVERDLRWDDNFPGWNNGNKVVYGDKWIEANFFDQNGECISKNIFMTAQVIRIPYLKIESDAQYSYIVEGFDLDGDGIADTIPATSSTDINATAVVRQVVNNYTVTFCDGDRVITTMTLPYGSTITLPENPTKAGYNFLGWVGYTESMKVTGDVKINSSWQHHGEGHVYGEMVHIDATCEEQGFDKYTCTICGEWYGENYTPALGHSYTTSVVDATCIEDGYTLHACECGYSYKDTFVDALGHSYGELITDVDATCTTDGQGHKVCARCSDVLEESIPAKGHEFTSTIIANSTCETAGTIRYECHCGHKVDETLPLAEHNYQKQYASKSFLEWLIEWLLNIFYGYEGNQAYYFKCSDCGHIATEEEVKLSTSASVMAACVHKLGEFELVKDATCQEVAVYGKKCSLCGEMVEAKIGALSDHTPGSAVKENAAAPDCVNNGSYDNVVYCTVCNAELSRDTVVVPALGHTESTPVEENRVEADCVNNGSYDTVVYCSVCKEELERVTTTISALGHTLSQVVVENNVAPSCTDDGSYDNVVYCTVCEVQLSRDTVVVPALGHTESTPVEENRVEADCVNNGSYDTVVYCSVCKEELERVTTTVSALGHKAGSVVVENNVEPNCTNDGSYDNVVYCTVCDAELSRNTVVVPATGHSHETAVTAPTCTEQGFTTYTCHCGDTYVADEVAALGHTEVVDQAVAPTCTTTGLTEGKHCDVCGETLVAQQTVDALGHTEGATVVENNVDPTCTADGSYDNVTRCGNCETELGRDTVVVPATGHSFDEWTVSKAPTCTEAGEERRDCNNCDHYETKELVALGHDYSNGGSCALCGKLSDGAVTGIVAGSAVAVGGGGFSLFWFVIKKKRFADLFKFFKK